MIHINPRLDETSDRLLAEHIVSNAGDERDRSPGFGCGSRLVRAFAAGGGNELATKNGFTRLGYAIQLEDHVGIRTTDYYNLGFHVDPPSGVVYYQHL